MKDADNGMVQGVMPDLYSSRRSSLCISIVGIIGQNKTPKGNMVSRCVECPVIESPLHHFSSIDFHPYCHKQLAIIVCPGASGEAPYQIQSSFDLEEFVQHTVAEYSKLSS